MIQKPALGGLGAMASSLLGDKVGGLVKSLSSLGDVGLSADKLAPFVSLLFGFLREKGGSELIGRVLGKVPELAKMVN